MALITLPFTVTGQQLEFEQPVLAEHAVGSIGAAFSFSTEWATLTTRTATFATIDAAYDVALVSDACTVPSEVLAASSFRVSVRGSDGANVLTTTIVRVEVASSLIGGETPAPPTPSVYDQLVAQVTAAADEAERAEAAEGAIKTTADLALSKANANAAQIVQNTTTTFKAGAYRDIDTAPASGSENLITSGSVYSALSDGSIANAKLANGAVVTDKIADGAVTAAKIAQSAKDAIMGGMTIKIFGNKLHGADNTGASYPDNMEMAGAYIPALDLLS